MCFHYKYFFSCYIPKSTKSNKIRQKFFIIPRSKKPPSFQRVIFYLVFNSCEWSVLLLSARGCHWLLRGPKFICALGRHINFDRYAILTSLHRPQDALRWRCFTEKGFFGFRFEEAGFLHSKKTEGVQRGSGDRPYCSFCRSTVSFSR